MAAEQPAAPVFRVILTLRVAPGRQQEFEDTWIGVGRAVAGHPANIAQWLVRSQENPDTYYIISDWPDEQSFRSFEKEPGHWELTGKLRELRVSGGMDTTTVLHHLPGPRAGDAA
ncbi:MULTISPECIES: antibiotic biosynthesis monooxygenase family protein [Streptomyces]|uniref:Antibiotic biosynthesis monooxygenase n=1 Tax=Streptomyces lycii TaxID=2654337 RepID=A0ABQ7FI40_9ACTN|nr:antibiotic biosynthesis monooxygenase family protein [Streptomyces lycii]KAF4407481.1 antibiotic biosynthesis monooxygenase [Streptomyces lycii]